MRYCKAPTSMKYDYTRVLFYALLGGSSIVSRLISFFVFDRLKTNTKMPTATAFTMAFAILKAQVFSYECISALFKLLSKVENLPLDRRHS